MKKFRFVMLALLLTSCNVVEEETTPKEIALTIPTEMILARTSKIEGDREGLTLSIEDTSIATLLDDMISANKAGTTNLVVSNGKEEKKYEFTVRNPELKDERTDIYYNFTTELTVNLNGMSSTQKVMLCDQGCEQIADMTLLGTKITITSDLYFEGETIYVVEKQTDGTYAATSKYPQTVTEYKESMSLAGAYEYDWKFSKAENKNNAIYDTYTMKDTYTETDDEGNEVSAEESGTIVFKDGLISSFSTEVEGTTESATFTDVGTTTLSFGTPTISDEIRNSEA